MARFLLMFVMRFVMFVAVIASVAGCMSPPPGDLPDTNIVFQPRAGGDNQGYTFGFVNADGSGQTTVSLNQARGIATLPVWSTDGKTLVFWAVEYAGSLGYRGLLSVVQVGKRFEKCPAQLAYDGGALSITPDGKRVFAAISAREPLRLAQINPDDCTITRTLLTGEVHAGAINSRGDKAVFQQGENIYLSDVGNTLTDTILIGHGIVPRWSPDDQWIAYTAPDGIYVVRSDGTEARRVVSYNAFRRKIETEEMFEEWPPVPSWSPDSQWLVYHKCMLPHDRRCTPGDVNQYSIFKINVETGVETRILDGGLNPYWR